MTRGLAQGADLLPSLTKGMPSPFITLWLQRPCPLLLHPTNAPQSLCLAEALLDDLEARLMGAAIASDQDQI